MVGVRKILRREASIENQACDRIMALYGITNLKLNLRGNNGWPDRIFFIPGGRPLLIEFKRPGEEPEPLQRHRHDLLKRLNYDIEVHDTVDGAVRAVAKALAAARLSKARSKVPSGARVRGPAA